MNFITRKGERKVRNSLSERAATVAVFTLSMLWEQFWFIYLFVYNGKHKFQIPMYNTNI